MSKIFIPAISWSDHDPYVFSCLSNGSVLSYVPIVLERILTHHPSDLQIQSHIQSYIIENTNSVSSPITLWEAHKAMIWGHLTPDSR